VLAQQGADRVVRQGGHGKARASITASSMAWTVAANSGVSAASGRKSTRRGASPSARAAALAVEKARKMSPELCAATEPERAMPRPQRRARRLSWCGSSGASVATTPMIEPTSGPSEAASIRRRPTGSPAMVSCSAVPKLACTKAPRVKRAPAASTIREAVPEPPLKP
jgi:hypothetical protein